jgi:hypothetical protein
MNTTAATWAATVAVRVPERADGDLASCACRRLETARAVRAVEVRRLRTVEPGLSATVVTLEVSVDAPGADGATVEQQLADAPGTETVEEVRR